MPISRSIVAGTTAYCDVEALDDLLQNLNSCADSLAVLVIVDNSPVPLMTVAQAQAKCLIPIVYQHYAHNPGLGFALNCILDIALHNTANFVWLFDQDTIPNAKCLEALLAQSSATDIAVFAPQCIGAVSGQPLDTFAWTHGRFVSLPTPRDSLTKLTVRDIDAAITAGLLVRVSAVMENRPNAKLFLDMIDFEWCLRIRDAGFRIVQVCDATLKHGLGNPKFVNFFGSSVFVPNYSPLRWYYYSRNLFWLEWSRAGSAVIKCKSVLRAVARLRTVLKDDVFSLTFPKKIAAAVTGLLRWRSCD